MRRDVYPGTLKIYGEEHEQTLLAAGNLASTLNTLERFKDAKSLLLKTMPVARRILGEGNETTLIMGFTYSRVLYKDDGATLDDLRESVKTLEETTQTARRVLGGAHPFVVNMEHGLRESRAGLGAREACRTTQP